MKKMTAILGLVLMYSAAFAGDATVVNQSKEVPSQKMYCNSSSYDGDALVCEVPKFKIREVFVNIANDGLSALGFCRALGYKRASVQTDSFWRNWMTDKGTVKLDRNGQFVGYEGSNGNTRGFGGCTNCHEEQYDFVSRVVCEKL